MAETALTSAATRDDSVLYTVGHSSHNEKHFLELLQAHAITAVCDVRSIPYSRRNPQFNKDSLSALLRGVGIAYAFLGKELGAKDPSADCCIDGKVQFELIAASEQFQVGLERLATGIERYTVALLCAEENPLICHRTILISRRMRSRVQSVIHIRGNGRAETNDAFEQRLLDEVGISKGDLFDTTANAIELAYNAQGRRISYQLPE